MTFTFTFPNGAIKEFGIFAVIVPTFTKVVGNITPLKTIWLVLLNPNPKA
jgi:hypothetical protein